MHKKLGLRSCILAQEAVYSDSPGNAVSLVRMVIGVLLLIEIAVALILGTVFVPQHGLRGIYKAASAFATVGLSSGVTVYANVASKRMLILTMYIGRAGSISFALALLIRVKRKDTILPYGDIIIG